MIELNKIYLEDCLVTMKRMPDDFIDLIIADPPYHKIVDDEFDHQHETENEFIEWQKQWISEAIRILKPTGTIYIFGSIKNNALLKIKLWLDEKMIYRNWITWHKNTRMQSGKNNFVNQREEILYYTKSNNFYFENPRGVQYESMNSAKEYAAFLLKEKPPYNRGAIDKLNEYYGRIAKERNWNKGNTEIYYDWRGKNLGNVFLNISLDQNQNGNDSKQHTAQKPEPLIDKLILASSKENELIYSPFAGSGTDCVCASRLRRKFIGSEIEKKHIDYAAKRLHPHTSKTFLF